MNILLSNDDGIECEGILKLAAALRAKGTHRILVIAPDTNRSGVSHAVSLLNVPVKLVQVGEDMWSCSGYPADCVIAAVRGALPVKPDMVLSGINQGENLGTDLIYSGTAAAARQASLAGIPAVALSLAHCPAHCPAPGSGGHDVYYWDMAAAWVADHLDELAALWHSGSFVNVNIPNTPSGPAGMQESWLAVKSYADKMTITEAPDGRWCFLESAAAKIDYKTGSDCEAVARNFVSITSVHCHPLADQRAELRQP
ncbi:MAG: 5'/3'-nucleotidase SurE [Treponema sp.]|nr:5'/3'-nucleotidase SurE [Treponema sp.]